MSHPDAANSRQQEKHIYMCVFISPETGSQETNKTRDKYTARESNTIPATAYSYTVNHKKT